MESECVGMYIFVVSLLCGGGGGSEFYKVVLLFLLLKYTVVSSLSLFKTLDCLVCQ